MQSSTAIAIRALIMLIVLISVPLFAIFGKNLPDVVKGLLEGRGLVLGPAPETAANGTPAAPLPAANNPFAQPAAYRASAETASASAIAPSSPNTAPGSLAPMQTTPSAVATADRSMAASSSAATGGNFAINSMSAPSAGSNPMSPPPAVGAPPVTAAPNDWRLPPAASALPPSSAQQLSATPPANFQSPPEATALTPSDAAPHDSYSAAPPTESPYANKAASATGATTVPSASVSDEKFRQAETRLRELGATHYMLETWGPDNNRYHFVCKMAIGGNADVSRVFQAFGDDPWQAMQTVLQQVEDWRARPQPQ
jgi:hypothetical protein